MLELGARGHVNEFALGRRFDVQVAGALAVKGEITDKNLGVDGWSLGRTGSLGCEIDAALHGYPAGLQSRNSGEVKVLPGEIEAVDPRGGVESGAP